MSQSNRHRPPAAHDHPRPGGNSSLHPSPTSRPQTPQPTPATTASKYPDTTSLQTLSPQMPPLAVLDERPLPRHILMGLAPPPSRPLRGPASRPSLHHPIMSPKHTTSQRTTTNAPAQKQSTATNSTRRSVAAYTARSNWRATMRRAISSPSRLSTGRPARD